MKGRLFRATTEPLHSGAWSPFKIDCDALSDGDWHTIARMISQRYVFGKVEGVPTGGWPLKEALEPYIVAGEDGLLIVDDVLTTGASMEEKRDGREAMGVVLFARTTPPEWVEAIFQSRAVWFA